MVELRVGQQAAFRLLFKEFSLPQPMLRLAENEELYVVDAQTFHRIYWQFLGGAG